MTWPLKGLRSARCWCHWKRFSQYNHGESKEPHTQSSLWTKLLSAAHEMCKSFNRGGVVSHCWVPEIMNPNCIMVVLGEKKKKTKKATIPALVKSKYFNYPSQGNSANYQGSLITPKQIKCCFYSSYFEIIPSDSNKKIIKKKSPALLHWSHLCHISSDWLNVYVRAKLKTFLFSQYFHPN